MGPLCKKGVECPHKDMHIDRMMAFGKARQGEGNESYTESHFIFQQIKKVWMEEALYRARIKVNENVPMLQFPNELLVELMIHMSPSSIGRLTQSSLHLSKIARDDYLWQKKCQRDFPGVKAELEEEEDDNGWRTNPWMVPPQRRPSEDPPSWEAIYKSWYLAQKREMQVRRGSNDQKH